MLFNTLVTTYGSYRDEMIFIHIRRNRQKTGLRKGISLQDIDFMIFKQFLNIFLQYYNTYSCIMLAWLKPLIQDQKFALFGKFGLQP